MTFSFLYKVRFRISLFLLLTTMLLLSCSFINGSTASEAENDAIEESSAGNENASASSSSGSPSDTQAQADAPVQSNANTFLDLTEELRTSITVDGIRQHLQAFQGIADANNGTRASGTSGYDQSAAYVQARLEEAGYDVTVQLFEFRFRYDASTVEQLGPSPTRYVYFDEFASLAFSPAGSAEGLLQAVGIQEPLRGDTPSGCDAAQFEGFVPGNVALVKRGICPFAEKANNAEAAGATAMLVFNDGSESDREGVIFGGTLGDGHRGTIPVIGLSFHTGEELYRQSLLEDVRVAITVDVVDETREAVNVLADTTAGRDDFVVVVGGHLDSVPAGPGIQDNGSGTATILEIALQMAQLDVVPTNKVRFAFWGAEEFGLLGSRHYVEELSRTERNNIALNLNFDMIASPNYALFVYDGDHSAFSAASTGGAAPQGSEDIEQVFHSFFAEQGLDLKETAFDGRSDYGPFIQNGIPAGGLFSGAESAKSRRDVTLYGGTINEAYDQCYHLPCDTIDNINWDALDVMSDAAAHTVLVFALTEKPVADVFPD
ncbi:MAG: M20/M25/M40 family metallo-hydrolase [Chloroflexota bacterium]